MFFDSVLFTDREWLEDFLERYKKEINIPFRCTGHVKFVDESIINAMKDAGCYGIDFGVQTFNEYIRKNLLNRAEINEEIDKAFSLCDNARLRYDVDLILGLPLMKEADYELPVQFMRRHKYFNRLKCYNIAYYPKLEMIKKARELGAISEQDVERYESGDIGDWFHIDKIDDPEHKRMKDNFEKLYKLYPVIPKFMVQRIMDKKLYRALHIVPGIVVAFLQLIAGIFKNDPRFSIYINNYVRHIKKKIAGICRKDNKT